MKPLDDILPEENEPQYKELITLIQQASPRFAPVPSERQQQILARVRERLDFADSDKRVDNQDVTNVAQFSTLPPKEVPRQHRFSQLVTLIAAVLIIGMFIGTALLIFQPRTPSMDTRPTIVPPIGPLRKPMTVHTQANGVETTMRITSGPYFLDEMLEVDLELTNHSRDTLLWEFMPTRSCPPSFPAALMIMVTGGEGPSDMSLQHNMADFGCAGGPIGLPRQILPNQTLFTLSRYIVLTNSGHITLTTQIGLAKQVPGQSNSYRSLPNSDPLAGYWPSLQINVQAGIPSDRLITGQQKGSQVTIDAPVLVRNQLLYASAFRCDLSSGYSLSKLKTITLQQPQCDNYMSNNPPNRFVKWTYAVGLPGYTVFSGSTHR